MAHIAINAHHPSGRIQPRLYGSFLEHLGRCIYGGIWEEGAPLSDAQGYRRDVREAIREIGVTQLRYPGGNFVSNYHWRDGVGPREDRPVRRELAWGGVETNRFGTHEFMEYCAQVGAEPYMCVNLGTGTPEEAADWLEYCNSRRPTTIARQRAINGHPRPFDARLWGLGNEMYGKWQIGQRTARDYALVARETAKAMRFVDPNVELVAVGHEDGPWWNETVLAEAARYIDHIALHLYIGSDDTATALAQPLLLEKLARQHAALADLVLTDLGLDKRIGIAIDEWNVWYRSIPRAAAEAGALEDVDGPEDAQALVQAAVAEEPYNLRDALAIAGCLNALVRCADIVSLANLAQLVNAIAPIHTTPDGLLRHTIFHPFALYSRLMTGMAIATDVQVEEYEARVGSLNTKPMTVCAPYLDTSAAIDPTTGRITCAVVNRAPDAAIEARVTVVGARGGGEVEAWTLTGDDVETANTFERPDAVHPTRAVLDSTALDSYQFPARSLTLLRLPVS